MAHLTPFHVGRDDAVDAGQGRGPCPEGLGGLGKLKWLKQLLLGCHAYSSVLIGKCSNKGKSMKTLVLLNQWFEKRLLKAKSVDLLLCYSKERLMA